MLGTLKKGEGLGVRATEPASYSATTPASLITFAQRSFSALTNATKASGDLLTTTSTPPSPRRFFNDASSIVLITAAYSCFTTSRGAPFGTNTPCHEPMVMVGNPFSTIVGTSGTAAMR